MARTPRAVQKQAELADRLIKGEGAEEPKKAKADLRAVENDNKAEPEAAEPEAAEPEAAEPEAAEPEAAEPEASNDDDKWRERYQALQGKYHAEGARFRGTIDGLTARIADLEKRTTMPAAPADNLDAEDVETYGQDFVQLVDRRAQRLLDQAMAKVTPQIEKANQTATETRQMTVQERTTAELSQAVPDWRTINNSPDFLAWLDEEDDIVGAPRLTLLRSAFSQGRTRNVIAIFKAFKNQNQNSPVPAPEPTRERPAAKLAGLAAPAQTRTASPGVASTQPPAPVTRQQIQTFYSDVARGVYKGRQAERDQMEKRINDAVVRGAVE